MSPIPIDHRASKIRPETHPSFNRESEDLPTQHVSVYKTSDPATSSVITPPPSGERKLSSVAFSSTSTGREDSTPAGTPLQIGDKILGFELVEELGQGAFARVFLARQESLARRPVALKVTLRPTREAEKLARLQHTHIVPVYSVHDAAPVQIICMPFLGRRTIADLIRNFREERGSRGVVSRKSFSTRPAKSTAFSSSRSIAKPVPPSGAHPRPLNLAVGEELPRLVGDPTAVLQVLGQLAAGLAHAHERGILHLDLKPANVLLADTGEPMLLDFNLSFDNSKPDRELIGGTVPYMSVEQLEDLRTRGKGKVDARTDLYSLGVMAFEMLTGNVPFPASFLADIDGLIAARKKGPPSIRALNPYVSPAVESIIKKLLAPDPKDRYQSAVELQTDIARHLNNESLAFARETSIRERFGKWRKRNPGVAGRLLAASFLGLALALGGIAHTRSEANANADALEKMKGIRVDFDKMRVDLVIPVLPGDVTTRKRGIDRAAMLLRSYGLPDDPNWEQRDDVQRLPESERAKLKGDLGEILLLLALALNPESKENPDRERIEIDIVPNKLMEAAKSCFPPESMLPLLLKRLTPLGGQEQERTPLVGIDQETDAHLIFVAAATEIAWLRYQYAVEPLERSIELEPGHAAAHFCLAYCRQHLGQNESSLERYDAARVLMPDDPRAVFQRGITYLYFLKNPNPEKAEVQFSRAIKLDSDYAQAYQNRALALIKLNRLKEAEEDLTTALRLGCSPIQIHLTRAQVRDQLKNSQGAEEDRKITDSLAPQSERDFLVRGMMRMNTEPLKALEDFEAAEKKNRRSIPALQNQLAVMDRLETPDLQRALAIATKGCELHPTYAPMSAAKAILLARLGKRDEARIEIEKACQLSADAEITYSKACVYALTSTTEKDKKDALELLRKALREDYCDVDGIKEDKDLKSLRADPEFARIVQAATTLKKAK